jgi:2'-5' RNA ligase
MTPNWFVAWPVVGADEWLTTLEAGAPGGLRFLAPGDLHVTLSFLDRYNPALLKKMTSLLKGLPLREVETIAPDRLAALPQPRRFSALAFNLADGRMEVEAQIAKWRDRLCREVGAKLESRPVLPHFTVARPERRIGEADRDAALEWLEQLPSQSAIKLRLERPRIYTWAAGDSENRYEMLN